ncbi:MAG: hypothetical protein JW900_11155 [Anaerolineae bacterium]|nr:hypothetical protein [Anaerolineae bacterium]
MIVWLWVGLAAGAANLLHLAWTVRRLDPQTGHWRARALVWGGAVLRWGLAALVLSLALQRGILPGLSAFLGLWLARSLGVAWFGSGEFSWTTFSHK